MANKPTATIIIPTKNRQQDLRRAIASSLAQTVRPEVLVMDDGSTDGTAEMVRREFPGVQCHRSETSQGVAVQRNRGAALAAGEILFSIDDDAAFASPHTVRQTLDEFDRSDVGAVAIPFINVSVGERVLQRAPERDGKFATASFWGTAYAVRRDLFLRLGGYRERLRQEMEEEDFCIRLLEAGYFTCLGNADPIHHFFSPVRDDPWRHRFGARNRVLFSWYNVPMPDFLVHLSGTCVQRIAFGIRTRRVGLALRGIGEGLWASACQLGERHPVRRETFRLFRRLRKGEPMRLSAPMRMDRLTATVVITTKNRKDELGRAVASSLAQTAAPEVLVMDDGSIDGTAEMIAREFPTVRLHRDETSRGYIVQRNRGARLASGDIIFSIDDDAEFPSTHTIAQTLAEFSSPSVAAIAIPFVNVNQNATVLQRASQNNEIVVTDCFIGTAHALRREEFLRLGGYREFLFHQGEEEDLCIRMLDAGYFTRLGSADPIHHNESPNRDHRRMEEYGGRNKILFCWYNVPMPYLLIHLPAAALNRLLLGLRLRRPLRAADSIVKGFRACIAQTAERRPVRRKTYRLFRRLRRAREMPIQMAEGYL